MPGALPTIGLPGLGDPRPASPGATGDTASDGAAPGRLSPTPGGLARLQDTLLRYAVSMLSGPTGLAAYLRGEWTRAVEAFDAALRVDPDDTPSNVMRARARELAGRLLPPDWGGVYSPAGK